jgi:hypothetical protein
MFYNLFFVECFIIIIENDWVILGFLFIFLKKIISIS